MHSSQILSKKKAASDSSVTHINILEKNSTQISYKQIDIDLQPPLKKTKIMDNNSELNNINVEGSLDAKSLNKYSRQNAALGKIVVRDI